MLVATHTTDMPCCATSVTSGQLHTNAYFQVQPWWLCRNDQTHYYTNSSSSSMWHHNHSTRVKWQGVCTLCTCVTQHLLLDLEHKPQCITCVIVRVWAVVVCQSLSVITLTEIRCDSSVITSRKHFCQRVRACTGNEWFWRMKRDVVDRLIKLFTMRSDLLNARLAVQIP